MQRFLPIAAALLILAGCAVVGEAMGGRAMLNVANPERVLRNYPLGVAQEHVRREFGEPDYRIGQAWSYRTTQGHRYTFRFHDDVLDDIIYDHMTENLATYGRINGREYLATVRAPTQRPVRTLRATEVKAGR